MHRLLVGNTAAEYLRIPFIKNLLLFLYILTTDILKCVYMYVFMFVCIISIHYIMRSFHYVRVWGLSRNPADSRAMEPWHGGRRSQSSAGGLPPSTFLQVRYIHAYIHIQTYYIYSLTKKSIKASIRCCNLCCRYFIVFAEIAERPVASRSLKPRARALWWASPTSWPPTGRQPTTTSDTLPPPPWTARHGNGAHRLSGGKTVCSIVTSQRVCRAVSEFFFAKYVEKNKKFKGSLVFVMDYELLGNSWK